MTKALILFLTIVRPAEVINFGGLSHSSLDERLDWHGPCSGRRANLYGLAAEKKFIFFKKTP